MVEMGSGIFTRVQCYVSNGKTRRRCMGTGGCTTILCSISSRQKIAHLIAMGMRVLQSSQIEVVTQPILDHLEPSTLHSKQQDSTTQVLSKPQNRLANDLGDSN
jgi:hypothetical protein